jgi:hypothetical protein
MQDYWYIITPLSVTQYDNYSDIENKDTKYNDLMLDLDKEWFVRQQQIKKMQL